MSSSPIPRRVQVESQLADPDTFFTPGQRKAIRVAVRFCRCVGAEVADYERLLGKIESGRVLSKRDRRRLQSVLNRFGRERLEPRERKLNAWAKSELWDAHRP